MTTIKGTVRSGRLELDVPSDWSDGMEVEIHPVEKTQDSEPMPPDEIARLLALMDQIHPLEMTDAEIAAWQSDRDARKQLEKAQFFSEAEKLRGMWE